MIELLAEYLILIFLKWKICLMRVHIKLGNTGRWIASPLNNQVYRGESRANSGEWIFGCRRCVYTCIKISSYLEQSNEPMIQPSRVDSPDVVCTVPYHQSDCSTLSDEAHCQSLWYGFVWIRTTIVPLSSMRRVELLRRRPTVWR